MTSANKMLHFLLVYDHAQQRLVREETFEDSTAATDAYADAERDVRERRDLEIVLVGADSIETIRQTHASYFDGTVTHSKYLVGT